MAACAQMASRVRHRPPEGTRVPTPKGDPGPRIRHGRNRQAFGNVARASLEPSDTRMRKPSAAARARDRVELGLRQANRKRSVAQAVDVTAGPAEQNGPRPEAARAAGHDGDRPAGQRIEPLHLHGQGRRAVGVLHERRVALQGQGRDGGGPRVGGRGGGRRRAVRPLRSGRRRGRLRRPECWWGSALPTAWALRPSRRWPRAGWRPRRR